MIFVHLHLIVDTFLEEVETEIRIEPDLENSIVASNTNNTNSLQDIQPEANQGMACDSLLSSQVKKVLQ